jgi:hypothetical protein
MFPQGHIILMIQIENLSDPLEVQNLSPLTGQVKPSIQRCFNIINPDHAISFYSDRINMILGIFTLFRKKE